jgi:hypothetical protein
MYRLATRSADPGGRADGRTEERGGRKLFIPDRATAYPSQPAYHRQARSTRLDATCRGPLARAAPTIRRQRSGSCPWEMRRGLGDRPARPLDPRTGGAGAQSTPPLRHRVEQLTAIPSVSETAASVLLAEIGTAHERLPVGRPINCRGQECSRAATRVRASGARRACATAPRGSRRLSCRSPGRPRERKTAPWRARSSPQSATRTQEGPRRRRCFDPHHRLSPVSRRHPLPGSRPRPLRLYPP